MRFNLSLKNVTDAINANSANAGGSVLNRGELGYVVRGIGLVQTLDDMGNIVVTQRNGTPILVRDLGKLKLSNQERHGMLGKDERNDAVEGIVLLLRGENPSRVMEGVHAKVAELNERLRAEDVQIVPYLDRSDLVDATVDKVSHTIFQGIGLVLIVLILFLGSPRSALIVGITIPFAMVVAFILMNLTKIPANLLSLGAIDFGIIVDGAIVMSEAILRRREAKPDEPLTETDAREAALQVARPIFFATLIIITAYVPLFAFQRVEAKLFSPMAYAVGYAQFGALAVRAAAHSGPRLSRLSPAAARVPQSGPDWLEARYRRALRAVAAIGRASPTCSARAAAVAVVVLGVTVWREFLPELDEGSIWLHVRCPPAFRSRRRARWPPTCASACGNSPRYPHRHAPRTQRRRHRPWTPSHIEADIGLHPYATWPDGGTKQDLIRRMAARFASCRAFEIHVSQPIIESVTDKVFDVHSQLVVQSFRRRLQRDAPHRQDIIAMLKDVPGAVDVAFDIDQEPPLPQIAIKVDREAAARYGINVADVSDLMQTGIGGGAVSQVFIGERRYDTTVRFPEDTRNSPEAIGNLLLTSSGGALVPLSQVARIQLQIGESTITRWMNQRNLTVKLNYSGRDLPSLLAEARRSRSREKVSFDPKNIASNGAGSSRTSSGRRRDSGSSSASFSVLMVVAALCRVRRSAPGAAGPRRRAARDARRAHRASPRRYHPQCRVRRRIHRAVRRRRHERRHHGGEPQPRPRAGWPLFEAVLAGAGERLRPVLMTAAVATVGMLPAAFATGVGSDVQRSVATVVAGGLPATLLTLFIIPTFYLALERRAARRIAAQAGEARAT